MSMRESAQSMPSWKKHADSPILRTDGGTIARTIQDTSRTSPNLVKRKLGGLLGK